MPAGIEVDPERLERWLSGFEARHGQVRRETAGSQLRATASDGAVALCDLFEADPLAVVLVRRGGYAVGVAVGGRLVRHKTGTRYVQSRTAAGGWSQQRFARRRANQADDLVRVVVGHVERVVLSGPRPRGLVLGGDRTLSGAVMDAPGLAVLAALPRRELFDLPDPRLSVLERAVRRGRTVRISVSEPGPSEPGSGPEELGSGEVGSPR